MTIVEILERLAAALQAALDAMSTSECGPWVDGAEDVLADFRAGLWRRQWEAQLARQTSIPVDLPAATRAAGHLYIAAVAAEELVQDIRLNSGLDDYFTDEGDWEKQTTNLIPMILTMMKRRKRR